MSHSPHAGQPRTQAPLCGHLVPTTICCGQYLLDTQARFRYISSSKKRVLINGDGGFVDEVLSRAEESFERRNGLNAKGVDLEYIADRVGKLLGVPVEDVWSPGRYRNLVAARSLIRFWSVRELGMSMTSLARRLRISTAAVSKSLKRG